MSTKSFEELFRRAAQRSAERSIKSNSSFRSVMPMLRHDVPTFIEAPHDWDKPDSDIVFCGFPYEGIRPRDTRTMIEPGIPLENTVYARDGAFEAPDAVRRHSLHYSLAHGPGLHHYEIDPEFCLAANISISDAGDLPVDLTAPTGSMLHEASDQLGTIIGADRVPILMGGDDITPYVGLRAVARQRKSRIAVIKFDAHFDLCWEPRYWAGSQWARAMEAGYLLPEDLAIIGIRGFRNPSVFGEVAHELGVRYWTLPAIGEKGIVACVHEAVDAVTGQADFLYLSFDVDVMDPAFLPAQKYPEPAGMTAREAVRGLRAAVAAGPTLCGFDLACLAPRYDVNGLGCQLAARFAVEVISSHAYRRSSALQANPE